MGEKRVSVHGMWSSRGVFIMAAVGSAVGLGNIWKFPYITGEYGGGAFVVIYLLCISLIGVPVMMAEILLGRRGRSSPIGTMKRLARYAFEQSLRNKLALALLAPAIRTLKDATDWQQYGGVPILGFEHLCIKAHGRSSARAVGNALRVAHKATRTEILAAIRAGLAAHAPS